MPVKTGFIQNNVKDQNPNADIIKYCDKYLYSSRYFAKAPGDVYMNYVQASLQMKTFSSGCIVNSE
jgi:hypothetical protein